MSTDRIVKTVVLRAPVARVWRAVSDSKQFGTWFGVDFDEPFTAGKNVVGRIAPTKMDAAIAKMQEPHAGARFEITVDRIEPMKLFSFRWHPFAIEKDVDYAKEPTTLVEIVVEEAAGGTRLTITESGFDGLPLARRAKAFESNEGGWTMQLTLIEKFVS